MIGSVFGTGCLVDLKDYAVHSVGWKPPFLPTEMTMRKCPEHRSVTFNDPYVGYAQVGMIWPINSTFLEIRVAGFETKIVKLLMADQWAWFTLLILHAWEEQKFCLLKTADLIMPDFFFKHFLQERSLKKAPLLLISNDAG